MTISGLYSYATPKFLRPGETTKEKDENSWFDEITSAKGFELYASGLRIALKNNQGLWQMTPIEDPDGVPMAEAVGIRWLEVEKNFPIERLTPRTSYKVSFLLKKKEDNSGLDQLVKLELLMSNQEPVERTQDLSSMPINEWTKILVGHFKTPCDHRSGELRISMTQTDTEHIKKGLVINKILIEPVMKDWKELSGENEWCGLLDPLDLDLSKVITSYGVILDAMNKCMARDKKSPKYKEEEFFSKVGPGKARQIYKLKKYIHARIDVVHLINLFISKRSSWIGYVAVATDEGVKLLGRRDILVCWRGTKNNAEWERNATFWQASAEAIYPNVRKAKVHAGFYSIYTRPNKKYGGQSARNQVVDEVKKLINLYKDEEVSITIVGYSLGAVIATLNASDIVCNGYNKPDPNPNNKEFSITTFVFGSPMVGNGAFKTIFDNHEKLRLLRIENGADIITALPPGKYVKVGNEITFNRTSASSYGGKENKSIDHNLKNYVKEISALPYSSNNVSLIPYSVEEPG